MSKVDIPPAKIATLQRIAQWMLDRGTPFDIAVEYEGREAFFDSAANPWSEDEWRRARRNWCHPFYIGKENQRSKPFSLIFPSDEEAVLFVLTALG